MTQQETPSLLPSDKEGYTLISNEALLGNTFALSILSQRLATHSGKSIEVVEKEIFIISNLRIFGMSEQQIKEKVNELVEQSMNRDKTTISTKVSL
ncbi:MAG TPA: hypothetical protein VK203_07780 [Nostocaceae cyanobacterium]|nr:hypothetical protein [Nostocaceae cyanobacterium]